MHRKKVVLFILPRIGATKSKRTSNFDAVKLRAGFVFEHGFCDTCLPPTLRVSHDSGPGPQKLKRKTIDFVDRQENGFSNTHDLSICGVNLVTSYHRFPNLKHFRSRSTTQVINHVASRTLEVDCTMRF